MKAQKRQGLAPYNGLYEITSSPLWLHMCEHYRLLWLVAWSLRIGPALKAHWVRKVTVSWRPLGEPALSWGPPVFGRDKYNAGGYEGGRPEPAFWKVPGCVCMCVWVWAGGGGGWHLPEPALTCPLPLSPSSETCLILYLQS